MPVLGTPTSAGADVVESTAEPCSFRGEHSEGPFWHDGRLGWVDSAVGQLWTSSVDGATFTDPASYDVGRWLGSAVPKADGGYLLAAGVQFMELDPDGTVTPLSEELGDPSVVMMDDGKCDPAGRFWAGSMAKDHKNPVCSLYVYDGKVRTAVEGVTVSNGLAWTADQRTMYYIDTPTRRVDAFDYDVDSGSISHRRTIATIDGRAESGPYVPDGMSIDDEGFLWVAIYRAGAVYRYAPDGHLAAIVHVPTPNVTSCCFGGPDNSTLFITTSRLEMNPRQRAADPHAGRIFRVDAGVSAPPVMTYYAERK
ncbi:SMP-30/gluconolactonase/LRE family protein [Nocardia transvalensis]|uniref:SMP-30/gluconolactonase/LRE family protein n=1 Tax=Nocardia transvalensis TaxID=37333 RepID=UPI0018956343|nr:SMP-30/gluconolactonase/LRE family protein [Nocardia transvalensis]MBF6331694.1 SMP-30/gluconolactonase/LRE family protein [Nocardia transvalensis]